MAVTRNGLSTHGMPGSADVDRPPLGGRGLQLGAQGSQKRLAGVVLQDRVFEDRGWRQQRCIVQRTGIGGRQSGKPVHRRQLRAHIPGYRSPDNGPRAKKCRTSGPAHCLSAALILASKPCTPPPETQIVR